MRLATALPLAAPLVLALVACGDTAPADTAGADTAGVDVTLPQVDPRFPSVAPDARTSVNYAGTYAQPVGQGERSITLDTNGTYVLRDPDGTESRGTYNWYADNSRILIKVDGENRVYAIADGALYRMPDEKAPTTGTMTEEQTYRRVAGPRDGMGASGGAAAAPQSTARDTAQ